MKKISLIWTAISLLLCITVLAQNKKASNKQLRTQLNEIIKSYKATVGIAIIHLESGDTLTLKEDLLPETWSPIKKKYPNGDINISVKDLLYFTVSESDNIGCDLLFKLMNGTAPVNNYIHQLGLKGIEIVSTENEMHNDSNLQYKNWCKPFTMSVMLKGLYQKKYLSDSNNNFLLHLMTESNNSFNRIKGLLPATVKVAHKTGTSGENSQGIRAACNDVGIITLPNEKHIALTVFVANSSEKFENDEKIIATISKAVFDYYKK